jgi:sugar lactone lactonase YvrE
MGSRWFNDGSCDARGRLFAGTMAFDGATDRGALYRFAAGHLDMVLSPVSVSNGLDWSPDNSTMYYVDSALQRIDRIDYDLDTGELGQRSPFVVVATEDGIPDGLCVDAAGYVWVAFVAGWCVRRFDPTGQLDLVVRLPVANVTACAFGGPTLEDLYITTASDGLDGEERERQPLAGALFRLRAPVSGRAGYHFDSSSLMSR